MIVDAGANAAATCMLFPTAELALLVHKSRARD
jgi:hypothetical protein